MLKHGQNSRFNFHIIEKLSAPGGSGGKKQIFLTQWAFFGMSTDHIDQVWSKSEDPREYDMNHWVPEYLLRKLNLKMDSLNLTHFP